MHDYQALFLLALVPLLISLCVILIRGLRSARGALYLSLSAHIASLAITIYLIAHHLGGTENTLLIDTGPLQFHWLQLWLPDAHASTAWLDVGIFMDTRGVGEFLCVLVISLLAHVYLLSLLKAPEIRSTFFAWCDITVLSLLLAVISPNLMQWYACLAIASASAWFMLNTVWRTPHEHNAWKWIIAPILSDAFFLMGIFIVIIHFGTAGLSIISNNSYPPSTGSNFESKPISDGLGWYDYMGLCFVAGALGRAALFPFHTWLMRLAPAASPAIAIFAPSAVIVCGPFLLFRMWPLFSSNVELAVLLCGNLSILIGSLTALVQTNIKQVVFSIMIAQTGICFVLLGTGAMDLALAAGIVMAIAVTGMLFTTGAVLASTQGRDDLRTMGGLWRNLPITAFTSFILVLACAWSGGPGPAHILIGGLLMLQHNALTAGYDQQLLFWIPVCGCGVLTLALCRWWWLIFFGSSRNRESMVQRESPTQTLALLLTVLATLVAGQPFISLDNLLSGALSIESPAVSSNQSESLPIFICSNIQWAGLVAMLIVALIYFSGVQIADRIRRLPGLNLLFRWLSGGFFLQDLYDAILGRSIRLFSRALSFLDRWILTWIFLTAILTLRAAAIVVGTFEWTVSSRIWDFLSGDMPVLRKLFWHLKNGRIRTYFLFLFGFLLLAGGMLGIMLFLGKS